MTRRTALAAAIGTFGTGVMVGRDPDPPSGRERLTDADLDTMVIVAQIVFPTAITEPKPIVSAYVAALYPSRRRGVTAAIDDLNRESRRRHGRNFAAVDVDRGERILRGIGVDRVHADPQGTSPERIRAYLVDGLLFALFTQPIGTELFNIENPLGYPGGVESALGLE